MDIVLQSLVVTFISLTFLVCSVAIFVGYLINKASELGGPGFLQTPSEHDGASPGFSDESRPPQVTPELTSSRELQTDSSDVESFSQRQRPVAAPGAPGAPLVRSSPCRFCQRLRDAARNAWNRL